jgi:hypothetical protein
MIPLRTIIREGAVAALVSAALAAFLSIPAPAAGSSPLAGAPPYLFGSTPSLNKVEFGPLSAAYVRLKAGGATWVRFRVSWAAVEWSPGKYYWPVADKFFAASACAGLAALPSFMDSPTWANGASTTLAPPNQSHYSAWQAFIRAAVARYGVGGSFWKGGHYCADGVTPVPASPATVWQIWNEPNVSFFWGGRSPSASAYAQLLAVADQAINTSANPNARIAMGGLANDAAGFLKALYAAMPQLNSHFEIFDVHAYVVFPENAVTKLAAFRSVANQYGASTKPIWVSEVGWSSCLQTGWDYPQRCVDNNLATDEAGQASNLTTLYTLLAAQSSTLRLERVAWYGWRDPPTTPGDCSFCYGAGLLHRDGTPKPAWQAYVTLAGGRP